MAIEIFPLFSFVMVTTFTPGPNNISSASLGVTYGYKKSFSYLLGISSGFFLIMITCACLSSMLLTILPMAERYLRWFGAGYIIWLAIGILRSDYSGSKPEAITGAFTKGFVLQLFNPKVAVYGLTLYSTFLAPISGKFVYLVVSAVIFSSIALLATSTWALGGAAIKNRLAKDSFRRKLNTFLSLLLIYTAIEITDIAGLLWK